MALSDWLLKPWIRRAFALVFFSTIAVVGALWLWPKPPPYPHRQTMESLETYSLRMDPDCVALLADAERLAANPRQSDECNEKKSTQEKGYRDLAQSVRASNAGEEAAWLSYIQARIALVGAALLVLTLGATAWAAKAATDAAQIAESAVAAQREIGVAQVRAYLTVETPEAVDMSSILSGTAPACVLKITNTGQSPAYNMLHLSQLRLMPFPLPDTQPNLLTPHPDSIQRGVTVAAKEHVRVDAELDHPLTEDEVRSAMNDGELRLYLVSIVTYWDVFKKDERMTKLCAYLSPVGEPIPLPGKRRIRRYAWTLANVQNDAT
ncbi:hypothetical protein BH10PSE6_BH10PSE6_45150 [soil metagenome]